MKKFVMGLIVGIAIATTGSIYADEGLQKIEAYLRPTLPITLNGAAVTLESSPVMYDGSTYLKLRDLAALTGLLVNWNDATQTVELGKSEVVGTVTEIPQTIPVILTEPGPQESETKSEIKPTHLKKIVFNLDKTITKDNDANDYGFIEVDNNQYVSVGTFPYVIDWKKPNINIKQEDKSDIVIVVSETYSTNVDAFTREGTVYVKLSTVGLKAHSEGDTLIIEKQ